MNSGSADFPLPLKTEAVSASRKTHTIRSAHQLEQRARLPHFHADRSRIVFTEGSNQKGRSSIQYSRIPTSVPKMQLGRPHQYGAARPQPQRLEHRQSAEQTELHVRYGQVEPSEQQSINK